jgi:hypothetical protein
MHSSPLMATAVVLSGLGLLAIPLHRLTSAPARTMTPAPLIASAEGTDPNGEPVVLRVRLLRPAKTMLVRDSSDREIWKAENLPAGETETDARISLTDGHLDLSLSLIMEKAEEETAIFFTVMPDGREERHGHLIGNGTIEDHLSFTWPES